MVTFFISFFISTSATHAAFITYQDKSVEPLQLMTRANELTVFWWNMECGLDENLNQRDYFQKNLSELALPKNKVDVLIFSEYCIHIIPKATLTKLSQVYPYLQFINYNSEHSEIGLGIFSSLPFEETAPMTIDWLPRGLSKANQDDFRQYWIQNSATVSIFKRPYTKLQLQKDGKNYTLIPIHLAHPWNSYTDFFYKDSPTRAKLAIAKEMIIGTRNPLICQLDRFLDQISVDYPNTSRQRILLIGDFNFPLSLFTMPTMGYRLIKYYGFTNGMTTSSSTQRKHAFKIDHAFINESLSMTFSEVLPLEGSDHFPIIVRIK